MSLYLYCDGVTPNISLKYFWVLTDLQKLDGYIIVLNQLLDIFIYSGISFIFEK